MESSKELLIIEDKSNEKLMSPQVYIIYFNTVQTIVSS